MLVRVFACLIVSFAVSTQVWGKKPQGPETSAQIVEPPAELRAAVDEAATRGRAIWELDQATALASDRMAPWLTLDKRVTGPYVTVREGPRFTTVWAGLVDGRRVGLYSASLDVEKKVESQNVPLEADAGKLPEPFPLTDSQLTRLNAIEAAAKAPFDRLAPTYNAVVLVSGTGFSVYLIPGNKDPDVIPVGGIVRVDVGPEGAVTDVRPLSKSIAAFAKPGTGGVPADLKTQLLTITELGDHPTESHVFASRTYGVPLFVLCRETQWYVQGEQIQMVRLLD